MLFLSNFLLILDQVLPTLVSMNPCLRFLVIRWYHIYQNLLDLIEYCSQNRFFILFILIILNLSFQVWLFFKPFVLMIHLGSRTCLCFHLKRHWGQNHPFFHFYLYFVLNNSTHFLWIHSNFGSMLNFSS